MEVYVHRSLDEQLAAVVVVAAEASHMIVESSSSDTHHHCAPTAAAAEEEEVEAKTTYCLTHLETLAGVGVPRLMPTIERQNLHYLVYVEATASEKAAAAEA